ncbi:hypothetical protein D3C87_629410 [compost metagenome]|uniref:hypothetical protein n=1 Tax=Sphingobacterium sp. BIGb0165 TaxID=2940615 RepID=UPI000FA12B62|nr:hypothetical protein [Sphingobacterium sp. BIGb0165]
MAQMNLSIEVLNYGLQLSMEFGKNWLKPINERLEIKFPNLNKQQQEECNLICKRVHQIAHNYVAENPIRSDSGVEFVAFNQFKQFILTKYNWLSTANLQRLYSQSCYYASK